jgi:hypothetical protein
MRKLLLLRAHSLSIRQHPYTRREEGKWEKNERKDGLFQKTEQDGAYCIITKVLTTKVQMLIKVFIRGPLNRRQNTIQDLEWHGDPAEEVFKERWETERKERDKKTCWPSIRQWQVLLLGYLFKCSQKHSPWQLGSEEKEWLLNSWYPLCLWSLKL